MKRTTRAQKRDVFTIRNLPYVSIDGGGPYGTAYYHIVITRDEKVIQFKMKYPMGYPVHPPKFLFPPHPKYPCHLLIDRFVKEWGLGQCGAQICVACWEYLGEVPKEPEHCDRVDESCTHT